MAGMPSSRAPAGAHPNLTGPSAQRIERLVALRVGPAVAAGAITYEHTRSEWQSVLVLACMALALTLLLRPRYPLHLMRVGSAAVFLAGPLIGALGALAVSEMTRSISPLTVGDLVAPVLGAWTVAAIGVWLVRRFDDGRRVRLAVIGTAEFMRRLSAEIEASGVPGYSVVGAITPDRRGRPRQDPRDEGPYLGSISSLRELVLTQRIELLVLGPIAPSSKSLSRVQFQAQGPSRPDVFEMSAEACLDLPVSMIDASQFYERNFGHVPLGTTNSSWLQYLLHPAHRESWPLSKRLLDLVVGGLGSILALPILLVCALAIKISDRGPVLYRQRRIGEDGREFELFKLRTLRPDADELLDEGVSEDELVTGAGRMLRRLHLNELPQLWHVLTGEMSLVGPRPEVPETVSVLEHRFDYYDRRHLLKPGITGWATVCCGYSGTPIGEAWKLCHDLYYLKRRSLVFDLLILVETVSSIVLPDPTVRPNERFIVGAEAEQELESAEADRRSSIHAYA
jgi:lipopolysaccharide/colanic/teichoic acid biosynthesis glycosyltransferase